MEQLGVLWSSHHITHDHNIVLRWSESALSRILVFSLYLVQLRVDTQKPRMSELEEVLYIILPRISQISSLQTSSLWFLSYPHTTHTITFFFKLSFCHLNICFSLILSNNNCELIALICKVYSFYYTLKLTYNYYNKCVSLPPVWEFPLSPPSVPFPVLLCLRSWPLQANLNWFSCLLALGCIQPRGTGQ